MKEKMLSTDKFLKELSQTTRFWITNEKLGVPLRGLSIRNLDFDNFTHILVRKDDGWKIACNKNSLSEVRNGLNYDWETCYILETAVSNV